MKPTYLEFCGINSFSEKTQIDFRALLSGGVFGIFGDTGSGKSTILDSIHFALYGVIERASKSMNDCINYKTEGMYVVFDFEITSNGVRKTYRVRRERKRKTGSAKAFLYEYTQDGGLFALAEGTREVDEKIEEIIGLGFHDFKMCIALPQGDFAALVKATTAERVKLVSRLFDLEKYGERLWKTVNEKYYQAEREVALVTAEMGQNDGGRVELIDQTRLEIEAVQRQLSALEMRLKETETLYETAKALQKEKQTFDEVCRILQKCETELPQMQKKREDLEKLSLATSLLEKDRAAVENEKEKQTALLRSREELVKWEAEEKRFSEGKQRLADVGFDERIVAITRDLDKILGASQDRENARKAEADLKTCREQYAELQKKCFPEDFEGEEKRIETELSALGEDDSLLDYLRKHCKQLFVAETYGEVRNDLRKIEEKYPQTAETVADLIQKYTFAEKCSDETFDIAKLQLTFKEIERRKKQLKADMDALQKRKRAFEENEMRKKMLAEEGKLYARAAEYANEKIAFLNTLKPQAVLEKELADCKAEKKKTLQDLEETQRRIQTAHAEAEKQKEVYSLREKMSLSLQEELQKMLSESGFSDVEEARALKRAIGNEAIVRAECKTFFERYELYKSKRSEIDESKFDNYDPTAVATLQTLKEALQTEKDGCNRKIASLETELRRLLELREKYLAFQKLLEEKEKRKNLCDELRSLLKSNRFLEYIASEYLQEISVTAGKTLLSLTGGRYFLQYDKEFKVGDNLDGGSFRAVKTLSGGETFLVSLSLALSLSGAIFQKSLRPIEFFFLDEGFGTLDGKLVDTVMDVLGKLSKNFAVGLISHVEELKHRIENKILVTGANEQRGSTVQMTTY